MKCTRRGTSRRIADRLARHHAIMTTLIESGVGREEASQAAYLQIAAPRQGGGRSVLTRKPPAGIMDGLKGTPDE